MDKNIQSVLMWVHSVISLNSFSAKINETDTFGPGDDDEIQFDDIGDDDEDIDDVSSNHILCSMLETVIFGNKLYFPCLEQVK